MAARRLGAEVRQQPPQGGGRRGGGANWECGRAGAAANAGDPTRALTAATTAPSPAQASGRTPQHPVRPWGGPHTTHTWRDNAKSDRSCCFSSGSCHHTAHPTRGGAEPLRGPKVRFSVCLMSAIKAPDPWGALGARRGRCRGMADLARNAPNRTFSSTVPRPKPATCPGPSPPPRRHPARPKRRAERPGTRPGPETALTPPAHGATAPNMTDSAVSRPVTTRPARRPGARSRFLARKCAPRWAW